jgi:hypothetical protein
VRLAIIVAVLCAALASSGCLVLSLQPAYDAESVAFDESLLGTWINADDGTQAIIDRGEWRSYKVAFKDRFVTRTLQGNLTRIGPATYLDLTEQRGTETALFLVPVHGIIRIEMNGDTLLAAVLDYGWFSRALERKNLERLTAAFDDRRNALIVSPTADIRRWLARMSDEAIAAPMTFQKSR